MPMTNWVPRAMILLALAVPHKATADECQAGAVRQSLIARIRVSGGESLKSSTHCLVAGSGFLATFFVVPSDFVTVVSAERLAPLSVAGFLPARFRAAFTESANGARVVSDAAFFSVLSARTVDEVGRDVRRPPRHPTSSVGSSNSISGQRRAWCLMSLPGD